MIQVLNSLLSNISSAFSSIPANDFLLVEIGIIILISAVFALFAKAIKQPPIIAYVIAGFIIGPVVFGLVKDVDLISSLSEIGIAFLLFLAGSEISFKKLKEVNLKKIFLVSLIQLVLVFSFSWFFINTLGISKLQGAYIGVILAFSSTMVVVKILSDKKELVTMHGRIVLSILLLQDLFAIIAIILFNSKSISVLSISIIFFKFLVILLLAFLLSKFILNSVFRSAANSSNSKELLLISALALLFLFIILSIILNLSIVIGAFIAGVCLANLSYKTDLESRISPLRDFFSILFFVALGMQITIAGVQDEFKLFLFLILGAFIVKPFIIMLTLRIAGYRQRTCFISSLSLAQLSEFSIIIAILGFSSGVLSQPVLSTIVITTILTMSLTVFFMDYQEKFYAVFRWPLKIFNFIPIRENLDYSDNDKKFILLIGCDRMGSIILKELTKEDKSHVIVLDYNPEIINSLRKQKIACIYGDIKSPDILEHIKIKDLKKVISTVPDLDDGFVLLQKIKKQNKEIQVFLTAHNIKDALQLYDFGADYVMIPRFTAGEVVSNILKKDGNSLSSIKKSQIERIKKAEKIHE